MRNHLAYISFSALFALAATPALSMSITNQDGETRRITITEDGERGEQDVSANETVQVCEQGCFITFPDGTLTAYQGNEEIVIRNGGPALAN